MSSPSSQLNRKIPFDVWGLIFSHYAAEESIRHPLETLLLVCKGWKEAALGHCALWNELNIYIGHNPTSQIWNTRLPLRLARSGPTIPLHIRLRNYLGMSLSERTQEDTCHDKIYSPESCEPVFRSVYHVFLEVESRCACFTAATRCIETSLRTLMGDNGELSARWRSFQLSLGSSTTGLQDRRMVYDLQAFNQATNLGELSLFSVHPIETKFPPRLDNVTRLHLNELFAIDLLLRNCEMPRLTDLTVEFRYLNLSILVPPKAFHQSLRHLTLLWDPPRFLLHDQILKSVTPLSELLSLCSQLYVLSMNTTFLVIIFNALRTLPSGSFQSSMRGKCLVNTENGSSCRFNDNEGPQSLEEIASMLGVAWPGWSLQSDAGEFRYHRNGESAEAHPKISSERLTDLENRRSVFVR